MFKIFKNQNIVGSKKCKKNFLKILDDSISKAILRNRNFLE